MVFSLPNQINVIMLFICLILFVAAFVVAYTYKN